MQGDVRPHAHAAASGVTPEITSPPDGKELQMTFSDRFSNAPKKIALHVLPVKGLKKITLNGDDLRWDGGANRLAIR